MKAATKTMTLSRISFPFFLKKQKNLVQKYILSQTKRTAATKEKYPVELQECENKREKKCTKTKLYSKNKLILFVAKESAYSSSDACQQFQHPYPNIEGVQSL